ncbi:unnamed protein product [Porites evermanni]|uniref:Uncharacterized protein n=1 Tax=Porites evermanni TaxID=104178 RepID=A0ABN8SWP6_9CNID|nr:unnamed protein product [Porites evermanni]
MATSTDMKGNVVKMEVDYSDTVDKRIPECEALAADGKLSDALDILLSLEKQTRTVSGIAKLKTACHACYKLKLWID